MMDNKYSTIWPHKYNICGVNISATTYVELLDMVIRAALVRKSVCVSHLAVHGLITGAKEPAFKAMLNEFEIVAPDGQPVRLALNLIHKTKLPDRCYGPEFMSRICQRAITEGIGVYLYGSHLHVVKALCDNLITRYPGLNIVGWEPSVFRPLTKVEDDALVHRINESGAGIIFLGLGCPLQERFAFEHKGKIKAVQICVGAAFDFHSGNQKMAPIWMQQYSLEWLFRLIQEPRRLWRRYLTTNAIFMSKLFLQLTGIKKY